MGQSSLPFTMGYPYLPSKDFHDNDHSVAGCISGFGRLLIFSAHKISEYLLLLLLFFPPAFLTIHAHEAQRATFYRGFSHCRITVLCFELLSHLFYGNYGTVKCGMASCCHETLVTSFVEESRILELAKALLFK